MMQAMLGFTFEARWLRHAHAHLRYLFPYLPKQSVATLTTSDSTYWL